MTIKQVPSQNYYAGRDTWKPIAIVIHIMEGSLAATDSWFQTSASRVSAHYGVGKNGDVHQYVQEKDSAWHAGRVDSPVWQLLEPTGDGRYYNPNYYTIGIEHEGDESTDWTDAMYATSSSLIRDISARWNIPLDRNHIIGHHEIYAPKACPGGKVDLNKLIALAGGAAAVPAANSAAGPAANPPAPAAPMKILRLGTVITTARLNIRLSPDRSQPPVKTVDAGTQLAFDGFTTQGETVEGNSKWFYTTIGQWFWSGAVK
jgi:N-acetyl-anhydromuramyl-L-alanine amidase AmpD